MISQREIIKLNDRLGITRATIDKDWVLGHVLNAMYSFDEIRKNLVFKGGTCLRKCYYENYRFSEDLDFTLLDSNFIIDQTLIIKVLSKTNKISGILFNENPIIKTQVHQDIGQGYAVKINFWGANHHPKQKPLPPNRWQTSIKMDISYSEKLLSEIEYNDIFHNYSDSDLITEKVSCYCIPEIVAEKIRSLLQRNRPRDIYDNWVLSNKISSHDYKKIKQILLQKAKNKNLDYLKIENFVSEERKPGLRRAWEKSLKHQLIKDSLPDFDATYNLLKPFIVNILNS